MEKGIQEIVIIFILILVNGFFSMSEMAIVASRKPRLRHKADEGKKRYESALRVANEPGQFLSTIQAGITLIGTIAGAFGGATLAEIIAKAYEGIPRLAPYSGTLGIATVVLMITFMSVIFGELVPKRIALSRPELIASFIVVPMRVIQSVFYPVVKILGFFTNVILRILGIRSSLEPSVTEDEVRVMIREGTRHGVFEPSEQEMVEAVFYVGERKAETFMTPRRDIVWIESDDTVDEIRTKIRENPEVYFFPVCRDGLDNIIGVVDSRSILCAILDGTFKSVQGLMGLPVFIPESLNALKVLEAFKTSKTRIVFLVDEYGGVQGQVSVEDIAGEIVGELPGESEEEPEIVPRGDGTFLVDGSINIDDFFEYFDMEKFHPEDPDYHTLAGLILDSLGAIPSTGERVDYRGIGLEVIDMDGIRIDKVMVKLPDSPKDGDGGTEESSASV